MTFITVLVLAISLAMDCFSVSITVGIADGRKMFGKMLRTAFFFGFFQALMPFFGYVAGQAFLAHIERFDHWIAFLVLLFLGLSMIFEKDGDDERRAADDFFSWKKTLLLSVATSIDALAAGLVFLSETPAFFALSCLTIGLVSFAFSLGGYFLGRVAGRKIPFNFKIAGGVMLILVGAKILCEHLFGC